jgi:hypothetical protein
MDRLAHLVGIAEALRTTFPFNPSMAALWMRQPLRRFDDRTPARVMVDDGLNGLVTVRSHLDCGFDWRQTERP